MEVRSTSTALQLKNVLYGTDFHQSAKLALPYALSIARRHGAKIYIAHVVNLSPFASPGPTHTMRAIESQAIREAKAAVMELSPELGGIPNEVLIRKGDVWKEISHIVEEKRIDLIVLGTHGREGISKAILGSVAEKIFRHAPCPVMTIGPRIHGENDRFAHLHTILVPANFSAESAAAVSLATAFAQANQARLYVQHVTRADEAPESALKDALRNLIPSDAELSFAPKVAVEVGVPSERILELADEMAVDLIVMGVKPPAILQGTATHQSMATACKVVSEAGCPVITVRNSSATK